MEVDDREFRIARKFIEKFCTSIRPVLILLVLSSFIAGVMLGLMVMNAPEPIPERIGVIGLILAVAGLCKSVKLRRELQEIQTGEGAN